MSALSQDPPPTNTTTTTPQPKTLTYYHAGPLFTLSDLRTNTALSTLISTHSLSLTHSTSQPTPSSSTSSHQPHHQHHHFHPLLPQDLEPRTLHPHAIRDADLRALLSCDLALFVFDGAELDAGTVVEYVYAKAADLPCVLLRTDFRGGGDQDQGPLAAGEDGTGEGKAGDKWNLMCSNWPRSRGVVVDGMGLYKAALAKAEVDGKGWEKEGQGRNERAAGEVLRVTAEKVVEAMEEVVRLPPRLPERLREGVYEWLGLMPGFAENGDEQGGGQGWVKEVLEGKVKRGLL